MKFRKWRNDSFLSFSRCPLTNNFPTFLSSKGTANVKNFHRFEFMSTSRMESPIGDKSGSKKDYYAILGVSQNATTDEIRKSYKMLARKHHPDLDPDPCALKFREINEAYQVLSHEESRRRYDLYGDATCSGRLSTVESEAAAKLFEQFFAILMDDNDSKK